MVSNASFERYKTIVAEMQNKIRFSPVSRGKICCIIFEKIIEYLFEIIRFVRG